MFKKIFVLCLVTILVIFAVACEQKSGVETPITTESSTATLNNVTPIATVTPTPRPVIYAEDLQILPLKTKKQAYLSLFLFSNLLMVVCCGIIKKFTVFAKPRAVTSAIPGMFLLIIF